MAIERMMKIKLAALSSRRQNILDALHKTGCVELSATEELADTFTVHHSDDIAALTLKSDKVNKSVEFITESIEKSKGKSFYPENVDFSNFFISYEDFSGILSKENKLFKVIEKAEESEDKLSSIRAEIIKLNNLKNQILPYEGIEEDFSCFSDTKHVSVFFGTIKQENLSVLEKLKIEYNLFDYSVLVTSSTSVIFVLCEKEISEDIKKKLSEKNFTPCPFFFNCTAREKIAETEKEIKNNELREDEIYGEICALYKELRELKILSDYYRFSLEKLYDSEKFRCTAKTFVLEGYLPEIKQAEVKSAVSMVTDAVFMEFSEPDDNDVPPTLTKNDAIVRQTEFVTDMYSVPNYRELDPNKAVFIFFMVFMGIIMADIGYGILMITLGIVLASRIKVDNGTRRLWFVIALGGVFASLFGFVFNSFFGYEILPFTLFNAPVPENGIENLKFVLILCLYLGIVHLFVGYVFKFANCIKQKQILDAILDGALWAVFFIALLCFSFNILCGMLGIDAYISSVYPLLNNFFTVASTPSLIVLCVCVVTAALTAGRKEKGFGKFTKGFGAVYGLINIMSDILSYARIFGLMLSGMIIASTFNNIGGGIIAGGGIGYILGPLVMLLGHTFNIAMGVLGAYIHDSRLQYIEFFSKFYTGEGRKFSPLGSEMKYVYVSK